VDGWGQSNVGGGEQAKQNGEVWGRE
jgi:hypothetical protein